MVSKLFLGFICLKLVYGQYYAPSYYPNYPATYSSYPFYPSYSSTTTKTPVQIPPPYPKTYPQPPQPNSYNLTPIYSPPTTKVYYLPSTPKKPDVKQENPKKEINSLVLKNKTPSWPCPLCDGFKDLVPNSKVPPPPKRSALLPDLKELIPTIDFEELKKDDFLSKLTPKLQELVDKPKSPKYRFDEDLLEGFLTGLGLTKS